MNFFYLLIFLILSSCDSFNPVNNPNSVGYIKTLGKTGHSLTVLTDKSLIIGGIRDEKNINDIILFSNNEQIKVGELNIGRYLHTATLLPNGDILVIGGYKEYGTSPVSEIELIDSKTYHSKIIGYLNQARAGHQSILIDNSHLMIVGGTNQSPLSSVEVFDLTQWVVSSVLYMNDSRSDFSSVILPNKDIIFLGGYGSGMGSIEKFDSKHNQFIKIGNLSKARFIHQSLLLPDNTILTVGGFDGTDSLSEAEVFHLDSGIAEPINSMSRDRDGFRMTLLPTGKVLILAGADMGIITNSVESYDYQTKKFTIEKPLDFSIESFAYQIEGTEIIIFGGTDRVESFSYKVEGL